MQNRAKGFLNILLILLVAAIGILAVVVYSKKSVGNKIPQEGQITQPDVQVQKLNEVTSSDEIPAIEQDLDSTNLDDLDQEVFEVDNTLQEL